MILTVCPNTALDKILFIDEWIPGTPMRTDGIINSVGGKGLNSAVVLRHLGVETVSLGFFAGKVGEELVSILEEYGIIPEAVWADGTNRVAHVISELKNKRHSHVIAGNTIVSPEQKQDFIDRYKVRIKEAEWVILAGTIPKSLNENFYTELIPLAKEAGVPCLIDAQKGFMREAIKAAPDVVKMNWEEFEWTFDKKAKTFDALVEQAGAFYEEKALKNFIITLGKDGILAFTAEGVFLASAPVQEPKNAAGAGDAVSSTVAWRLLKGDSWEPTLIWASAVSAASVLTDRTGDVVQEDIDRIFPQVTIKKLHN